MKHGGWFLTFHQSGRHLSRFIVIGVAGRAEEFLVTLEVFVGSHGAHKVQSSSELTWRLSVRVEELADADWLDLFRDAIHAAIETAQRISTHASGEEAGLER